MVDLQPLARAIAEGFALGLATGASCVTFCAPVVAPFLAGEGRGEPGQWVKAVAQFCGGRFFGYAAVLGVALLAGAELGRGETAGKVFALPLVALAALLVAYGLGAALPEARLCRRLRETALMRRFPWVAGGLVGLAPCPPLLMCAAAMAAKGNVWCALAGVASFFAATSVVVFPLSALGALGRAKVVREMAQVAAVVAGLWFLALGLSAIVS